MKVFLVSLVAACALMMALVGSAFASPDSNFPEGVSNAGTQNACATVGAGPGAVTGSVTGLTNKGELFADACLGGP